MTTSSMSGRTVLITGTTSGIGKATAVGLAARGANLILVDRPGTRGVLSAATVRTESTGGEVRSLAADLSAQSDVRRLADSVTEQVDRLEVVIHNAGVYEAERRLSVNGVETTWAVNVLAPYLLTRLLTNLLTTSRARVIWVASVGHKHAAGLHWEDLGLEVGYTALEAYNQSKLAAVMLTYEFARRFAGTGVTANSLHPGGVATNLIKAPLAIPWYWRSIRTLSTPFLRSPERGADTSIFLATSPEVEDVSGKYYVNRHPRRSSPASRNEEDARRLWAVCEAMTGFSPTHDIPADEARLR